MYPRVLVNHRRDDRLMIQIKRQTPHVGLSINNIKRLNAVLTGLKRRNSGADLIRADRRA